jgi:fido (protein-threonine AMPylation protein)
MEIAQRRHLHNIRLTGEDSEKRIRHIAESVSFKTDITLVYDVRQMLFGDGSKLRQCDIHKCEAILGGKSCCYTHYTNIESSLYTVFLNIQEKEASILKEGTKVDRNVIFSLAIKLASSIWIIHPYSDGNTRLTVVILLIYLRHWGIELSVHPFAKYPVTFRNTLVRTVFNGGESQANASFAISFLEKVFEGSDDFYLIFHSDLIKKVSNQS